MYNLKPQAQNMFSCIFCKMFSSIQNVLCFLHYCFKIGISLLLRSSGAGSVRFAISFCWGLKCCFSKSSCILASHRFFNGHRINFLLDNREGSFCHRILCTFVTCTCHLRRFFSHIFCNYGHNHLFLYMILLDVVKTPDTHWPTQHFHLHYQEVLLIVSCRMANILSRKFRISISQESNWHTCWMACYIYIGDYYFVSSLYLWVYIFYLSKWHARKR